MNRRGFLATPAALAAADTTETHIYAYGDGIPLSSATYGALLQKLAPQTDDYSRGGVVEQLENRMAAELGKEAAVWMPTGTLANQLAVRLLAQSGRRVLVQEQSHLYNDCGDCAQTLSQLTLVPLGQFTDETADAALRHTATGRVSAPMGALSIETPIRRLAGQRFDFEEIRRISAWAARNKIGRHLDGARLYIECAYTGRDLRQYTALFDTVYVSMYKYFNAASGAVLAGPRALLKDLYHTRRMFGGSLSGAWPFAAVALHYVEGFAGRMRQAAAVGEAVTKILERDGNFVVERIPQGTNIFRMKTPGANAAAYQNRLEQAGITLRVPADQTYTVQVNETWLRATPEEIVRRFRSGLG
jgi:threonine aldolase